MRLLVFPTDLVEATDVAGRGPMLRLEVDDLGSKLIGNGDATGRAVSRIPIADIVPLEVIPGDKLVRDGHAVCSPGTPRKGNGER